MKLGLLININNSEGIYDKFEKLRQEGFCSCQVCSWTPSVWTNENAKKIIMAAKENDIEISAFWCGWEGPCIWNFYEGYSTIGLLPTEYRKMRIKNLCDGADFAKKIGVNDVVTHMGFIPENPYDPEFLPMCNAIRKVAEHLEKNGQYLLFETGQETPVAMLRCFEQVNMPNLGVNLDTANLILYGKANPVDALDVIGKYVRNLHVKDGFYPTNGHDLGSMSHLGKGKVDFVKLFTKLKKLGYQTYLTLECELDGMTKIEDVCDDRDYIVKVVDEIYGEGTVQ